MADDFLDKPQADLLDLAVPIVTSNPTWADMLDVFAQVMDTNVENPVAQLEKIRFIGENSDDNILQYTARLLGFDLTQDVLNLNADNLTKIATQLSMYPDSNGTEIFVKFIDLVLNATTEVENLYTKDYVNFYLEPQGPLVDEGGVWFKTTHIELGVALLGLEELQLGPGVSLIGRIKELFYDFAPAALVIERFNLIEVFPTSDIAFGAAGPFREDHITIE
jgi:hypothetical protein